MDGEYYADKILNCNRLAGKASLTFSLSFRLLVVAAKWRNQNPNPWASCKTFQYFLAAVVFGGAPHPQTIVPNQTVEADGSDYWEARVRLAEEKAKQRAEEYRKEQEEYLRDLEEIGDANEDLVEFSAGFVFDPIRGYLFPIQQYLSVICAWACVVKNVMTWEESYISFLACMMCFISSLAVIFVPWAFFIKWTFRIIVWCALGPWMKFADIFYFSKLNDSDSEVERKNKLLEREKKLKKHKEEIQLKREKVGKLRDFKSYMFGNHICRVNILKQDRYYDIPLNSSSATPCLTKKKSLGSLVIEEAGDGVTRIEGQQLEGEMIPKVSELARVDVTMTFFSINIPSTLSAQICDVSVNKIRAGQVTGKTELLKSGTPGRVYSGKDDSSISAAIKVGSIVLGAGFVTVYSIPVLAYFVRLVIPK